MDFIVFVVNVLFSVIYVLMAARAALPWVPHDRTSPLIRPIYLATEPFLSFIRLGLPPGRIGMDVSPFVMIILLWIIHQVVLRLFAL